MESSQGGPGDWACLQDSGEICRVLERQKVWGDQTYQVWVPSDGAVLRVREEQLVPLNGFGVSAWPSSLVYRAAAARIADALEGNELVAPLEGSLIPLPHQIQALSRAISGDGVRYLLADEVGLGKTIEAGLIMKELKIRGLLDRTLVVAPSGLVMQWVQEMRTHFDEEFRLVVPRNLDAIRQVTGLGETENAWRLYDQVVCPLDSVKPVEGRRGWSREQTARYNRERFEDLVTAGWDLIIIDEAHRLAGSSKQVARYQLGEALSHASPYLLLLSATPHRGKTDAFRRLMSFLDPDAFPDDESIRQERVAPYVIRTEKRHAVDTDGEALFKPREVRLLPVRWKRAHQEQRALYNAVTEYVREGYGQAMREKETAVGLLMILMQRLVTSSTRAIRRALERRLEALELPEGQLSLFGEDIALEWSGLESDEQLESVLRARLEGLRDERSEVELLLSTARRCEAGAPDAKAHELIDLIHRLEREENDQELKLLLFTEFTATQEMLVELLGERGFAVAALNGSMDMNQRRAAQRAFAEGARILVSTEAGGEGLNLQFCHVVVNYDLPWNPMRLEQRIGRVDRIGQEETVRAFNFALEETVESRVREVLEEKLDRILDEFGADKLGDVLDSEEVEVDFNRLYADTLLHPDEADASVDQFAANLRQRAAAAREGLKVLGETGPVDASSARRVADHQLPFWTERMTLRFLRSRAAEGADVAEGKNGYDLTWPNGEKTEGAVFLRDDAVGARSVHLTVEDPHIRALVDRAPVFAPGQPLVRVQIPGVSDKVAGLWSLWRVSLEGAETREERVFPVFLSDDDRVLGPTARTVWDRVIQMEAVSVQQGPEMIAGERAGRAYERSRAAAENSGTPLYRDLLERFEDRLDRERTKMEQAFASRRRAIERVGLPEVRRHRIDELEREIAEWQEEIRSKTNPVPCLSAVLLLRVAREGEEG